ncbi:MAG: hypothetical protein D6731_04335 [Planctomycetota bacterium]|nr:MAG: hypothetical protein D6731_04335 [Planctomycetota bacterium]
MAVMAGGDLAVVLARSVERECAGLARASGLSSPEDPKAVAAFEERARCILQSEPFVLAPYVDPRRMLLFTTRHDSSVPSFTQERLLEALDCPERDSLPTGHCSAIVYLPWILSRAREFLCARLGLFSWIDAAGGEGFGQRPTGVRSGRSPWIRLRLAGFPRGPAVCPGFQGTGVQLSCQRT